MSFTYEFEEASLYDQMANGAPINDKYYIDLADAHADMCSLRYWLMYEKAGKGIGYDYIAQRIYDVLTDNHEFTATRDLECMITHDTIKEGERYIDLSGGAEECACRPESLKRYLFETKAPSYVGETIFMELDETYKTRNEEVA